MNETAVVVSGDSWNPPFNSVVQTFGWLVAGVLSLETILGNAMVLLAYRLERSISRQLNNRFIISLAISDLIIGLEGIPFFTIYVINGDRWPLGAIACEMWLFLDYTLCLVSILTVLLITADRYFSVCHTASYLKWQTPLKMQMLIFGSWILPALIFGIMIYGWPWIGGEQERIDATSNGECYAPFLSNPFVNMSMYLAYYWTTLIAMLILYKGIHKAAKKLEKRSKQREHRHIALLLTQRLGTQVGVGLMLHAKRYREEAENAQQQQQNETKDSGCVTNNTLSNSESSDRRRSSTGMFARAVQRTQRLTNFRESGKAFAAFNSKTTNPGEKNFGTVHVNSVFASPDRLERLTEQNSGSQLGESVAEVPTRNDADDIPHVDQTPIVETTQSPAFAAEDEDEGNCSLLADEEDDGGAEVDILLKRMREEDALETSAIVSLSTGAFNEESLSSVLRFNPSAGPLLDPAISDTTSQILASRKTTQESQWETQRNSSPQKTAKSFSLTHRTLKTVPIGTRSLREKRRYSKNSLRRARNKEEFKQKLSEEREITLSREHVRPDRLLANRDAPEEEESKKLIVPSYCAPSPSTPSPKSSTASSANHHHSREKREQRKNSALSQVSRRSATRPQQQLDPQTDGKGLGRFFQRIHSWVRTSMVGLAGDQRVDMDAAGLPSYLHSSRSFSSASSISSTAQGGSTSRQHSLMPIPTNAQQIPMLTITRESIRDGQQNVETTIAMYPEEQQITSPPVENETTIARASKGSGILQTVFAPISALQRRRKRTKAERRAHKAFRTITFIVGLFAILWSPYYVVATVYGFCHGQCIPALLYNISYYMCYLNSSLNPFAYALANRQFRSAFARILKGNLRQQ